MKLRTTLLTGLVILHVTAFSQVELGVSAGLIYANLHEQEITDEGAVKMVTGDRKPGFSAGVLANIPLTKHIMIQTGINYLQKKVSYSELIDDEDFNATIKMNHIEVPLQFVYRTNNKDLDFLFGFGPAISYAFGGNIKLKGPDVDETVKISYGNNGLEDDMKPLLISGNVLMGVQVKEGIMVTANYNFGLNNLHPGKSEGQDPDLKFNSSYWGIKIGYVFGNKAK
jgi:hypothetical protein